MTLTLIWAESKNGVIGDENSLVWNLKKDMKHFRSLTKDKTIVMGRKTYESIGKPLPYRRNIVMTRNTHKYQEIETMDKEKILDLAKTEDVIIIGGLQIYTLFMPYADIIYQTIINKVYEGDTMSPKISSNDFYLYEKRVEIEDKTELHFKTYKRKFI